MKVHLIKEKTIRAFVARHSGSKISFEEWLSKTKFVDWNEPNDIKSTFLCRFFGSRFLPGSICYSREQVQDDMQVLFW